MSTSAWTDLNSKGNILKLHDKCPNPECGCQKIITFTTHQYVLQTIFRGTKKAWDSFIEAGSKMTTTLISAAVAAKTKNPQLAQITNNIISTLTIFSSRFGYYLKMEAASCHRLSPICLYNN